MDLRSDRGRGDFLLGVHFVSRWAMAHPSSNPTQAPTPPKLQLQPHPSSNPTQAPTPPKLQLHPSSNSTQAPTPPKLRLPSTNTFAPATNPSLGGVGAWVGLELGSDEGRWPAPTLFFLPCPQQQQQRCVLPTQTRRAVRHARPPRSHYRDRAMGLPYPIAATATACSG